MQDRKRYVLFAIVCALLVLLSLLMPLSATHAQSAATLSTDQKFYSVGQGMVISGKGFSSNAQIHVSVQRPDQTFDYLSAVSDGSGAFSVNYTPPQEPGRYNITATDGVNTATIAKTEADAIGYNKNAYNKGDTTYGGGSGSNWTTGEIKNYLEGQWTFYQYQVTGVGGTIPNFDVFYDESNSKGVFVDGLANFRACLDCTDGTFLSGPSQGMLLDSNYAPPTTTTSWVDAHTAMSNINQQYVGTTCGGADVLNTPSPNNCFSVNGATLQSLLSAAWIKAKGGTDPFLTGTHTVTLYYAAHLARTTTWSKGKEYLLGCPSDINYIIASGPNGQQGAEFIPVNSVFGTDAYNPGSYGADQYSETSAACPPPPPPALPSGDWTTAAFIGAGSDNGASYHFNINSALGSQGNLALPIPNVAAATGSITIVKATSPSVATNTLFNFGGDLGSFQLATDPAAGKLSTVTFSNLDGGSTYNINENSLPAGWTNTSLTCTGGGTFTYGGDATNGQSVAIALSSTANSAVTCTFTNTSGGHIIVRKHTTPSGALNASFPFATTGSGYTTFNVANGGSNTDGGTPPAGGLTPGVAYTISEGAPQASQGGSYWALVTRTCSLTTTGAGTSTFPASLPAGPTQPNSASITLGAGDTVTCDYYNDWPDGNITITPPTPVNEIGHAETFTVTVNQVPDGATAATSANITYTVSPTPDSPTTSTCGSSVPFPNTSPNTATCTITIDNSSVGKFTVRASASFVIGGVTLTRTTGFTTVDAISPDAGPAAPAANSADGVKTYVDARIGLTPAQATNAVGQPHTITATVSQNLGDGKGFVAAPDGTLVTFNVINSGGATASFVAGNTCTTTTGICTVQINSPTAGSVAIHATTTFNVTVNGVSASLTRASGDGLSGDSADAQKTYVGGTITIHKVTLPAGGTGFGYTTTGGLTPSTFTLNDGGSQVYNGLGVGTFTIAENDPTPGYDLSNLACSTVSGTGTTATPNLATRTLSVTLGIGGNVDCTYTNTKRAHLIVQKITHPTGAFSASFPFSTTGTGYAGFSLIDGGSNTDGGPNGGVATGLVPTPPGGTPYTISEGAPIASQGGSFWVLASVSCSITTKGTNQSSFVTSTTQATSVTLAAGDTVTCVYTNDWPDGNITISPPNPVNEVGNAEQFTVAVNQVTDGATAASSANITYTVTPTPSSTSSTCGPNVSFNNTNTATCTVTINNSTPGTFDVKASATFTVGTATLTRTTGATGTDPAAAGPAAPAPNSPDAVKNYVDANITIGPATAKNEANQQHTFNIAVTALPSGTGTPTFGTVTATVVPTPSTLGTVACSAPVGNSESCTLTINNNAAGVFTANACTTVTMGGVTVSRCTNDAKAGDVGPAVKTYINPGTTLSLTTPPAAKVHSGDTVTLTVTETNTGGDPLTNVTVTGGGACAGNISPTTPISLAAGASQPYTCTFKAVDGANAWSATGNGTDSLNNPVSTTNEVQSGTVNGTLPATTLSFTTPPPTSAEAGSTVTIALTETNTGDDTLSNVTVAGGGACAGNITPTAPTSLAPGASQAYTCKFTAAQGPNAWSATGNGTDSLGAAVPTTNEVQSGTVNGISASTRLTFVGENPSGVSGTVEAGTAVTITVNEANTGNSALSSVSVTGSPCATWVGPTSLAVGANANFSCTFNAVVGTNNWSASGHGLDSLGNTESTANEQQSGSFGAVLSTLVVVKNTVGGNGTFNFAGSGVGVPSSFPISTSGNAGQITFAGILSGPKSIAETVPAGWLGNTTNVSCSETAPGLTPSSVGTLTSGTVAAGGTVTANVSLGMGATVTCTFTNALLPTLNIIKNSTGLGGPFNFIVTGPSPETPSLTVSSGNSAQEGVHSINVGNYTFAEDQGTLPPGFSMTDLSCSTGTGSQPNNNGIPTLWSFTANYGDAIVCEATNSDIHTTRTQGFWATHTALANNVWNGAAGLPNETPLGADAYLCTTNPITAVGTYPPNPGANELMGGFWASISQLATKGGRRNQLDQARMQMLQQYLAAVLNVHAFSSGSETMLTNARTAYCGNDVSAIKAQVGILGTFNQSGDSSAFTPGASATTQESRNEANIAFWDVTFE